MEHADMKKAYGTALDKALGIAFDITQLLSAVEKLRNTDEDNWGDVGTMNCIAEQMSEVRDTIASYKKARVDEHSVCETVPKFPECKIGEPIVVYTGGGIYIAGMYTDAHTYCIIDTINPSTLAYFCDGNDGYLFECWDICNTPKANELTDEQKHIYNTLKDALIKEAGQHYWDTITAD